jgi:hypothetical protein
MQSEEEKWNHANDGPRESNDRLVPAPYTPPLFTKELIDAASQRLLEEGGGSTMRVTAPHMRG